MNHCRRIGKISVLCFETINALTGHIGVYFPVVIEAHIALQGHRILHLISCHVGTSSSRAQNDGRLHSNHCAGDLSESEMHVIKDQMKSQHITQQH